LPVNHILRKKSSFDTCAEKPEFRFPFSYAWQGKAPINFCAVDVQLIVLFSASEILGNKNRWWLASGVGQNLAHSFYFDV